jgi:hypothetical protein
MHFIIPIIVFVTANIWGLYSSIPFTNIDPDHSIWDRALGGVQLASTVYTLDQIPRLLGEEAITHHLIKEYLGGWNATVVSETESAMALSAGHRPLTAPLTVPPGLLPSPTLSTALPVGLPNTAQHPPVDSLVQILLSVIFALVVWLMVKQNNQIRRLTTILEEIGLVQQYQETAWKGIYENHTNLAFLVSVAQDLRTGPAHPAPVEEVSDAQEHSRSHDSEGSTSSSDASSAVVNQTLQDVLASMDTLRQTIDRSTNMWEGLSERWEVFRSGSQDTQPTESSGDDPNGSPEGGLSQDG